MNAGAHWIGDAPAIGISAVALRALVVSKNYQDD